MTCRGAVARRAGDAGVHRLLSLCGSPARYAIETLAAPFQRRRLVTGVRSAPRYAL